jgi:hypothetical protein
MSDSLPDRFADDTPEWRSTSPVVSFVLRVLSWELTAALFGGRWLFGSDWLGAQREWAALGVSLTLSLYHWFWGRRLLRRHFQLEGQSPGTMNWGQAMAVVVLMIAGGAFGTWLFCWGPRP